MDPYVILRSALEGEEITTIEALLLMQQEKSFIPEIFQVADEINKRLNRDTVTFVHSNMITYTNVCRAGCKFCSYYRKKGEKGSFVHTIDSVLEAISANNNITEVCLQGGLNPELKFNFFHELFKQIRKNFPGLHIHALSPAEIYFLSKRNRMPVHDILTKFKEAGLNTIPGTAAEILNDKLRKKICPDKIRTNDWIDIVKTAHRMDIKTSVSLLYGHIEDEIYVSEHMEIIRNIQKETGGITEFIAIPFMPDNSQLQRRNVVTEQRDWDEIFRVIAVCRIYFGTAIRNIQLNWHLVGLENAVHGVTTGVNDIGNTIMTSSPKNKGRKVEKISMVDFEKAFTKIGRQLKQRDSYYNTVTKTPKHKVSLCTVQN